MIVVRARKYYICSVIKTWPERQMGHSLDFPPELNSKPFIEDITYTDHRTKRTHLGTDQKGSSLLASSPNNRRCYLGCWVGDDEQFYPALNFVNYKNDWYGNMSLATILAQMLWRQWMAFWSYLRLPSQKEICSCKSGQVSKVGGLTDHKGALLLLFCEINVPSKFSLISSLYNQSFLHLSALIKGVCGVDVS